MSEKSPEQNPHHNLPKAEDAPWAEFLDPHKAIKNFKALAREIGELI